MDVDLDLHPNEASDLAALPPGPHLAALGWDAAYATVLDETRAEDALAVLGHREGAVLTEGWEARRVTLRPVGDPGRTSDAEACAVRAGHLWLAGSHFGSKDGPLQPRRAWFGRVALRDLWSALEGGEAPAVELVRNPFSLHRAVNDALAGADLLSLGAAAREALVEATVRRGEEDAKRWAGRVRPDDMPVNVEGMAFRPDGTMLLGLRHPVTAGGDAVVVELGDPERLLREPDEVPPAPAVWILRGTGSPSEPVGVRAMQLDAAGELHIVLGSLDALGKDSVLVAERPAAGEAHCAHWRCPLPAHRGGGDLHPVLVEDFPGERTVEGVARTPDGHWLYVIDRDDAVGMRFVQVEP